MILQCNQGEALYIIRNLLRYIINTKCCISSSRRKIQLQRGWWDTRAASRPWWYAPHVVRRWYAKPAAWINKKGTFGRQKFLFCWLRRWDLNLMTFGLWARRATRLLHSAILWCRKPGSNRYEKKSHGILSPGRLPIPPFRHAVTWWSSTLPIYSSTKDRKSQPFL